MKLHIFEALNIALELGFEGITALKWYISRFNFHQSQQHDP